MDDDTGTTHTHEALPERLSDAARELAAQPGPDLTYETATALALSNVDGAHAASLSMVRSSRGRRRIDNLAATHPAAAHADDLQTTLGEGPCLSAITDAAAISSPSLAYDHRWPRWGPQVVADTELHSVLSVRLFTHANILGALNLYSRDRDGFTHDAREDALALAAHIAVSVAAAERIESLNLALASRTVIGQATGMLMERFQLTPDVAFGVLVRVSSQANQKVRVVADQLVRTGHFPDHTQRPPDDIDHDRQPTG